MLKQVHRRAREGERAAAAQGSGRLQRGEPNRWPAPALAAARAFLGIGLAKPGRRMAGAGGMKPGEVQRLVTAYYLG